MSSVEGLITIVNELIACINEKNIKTHREAVAITRAKFWIDKYRKSQATAAAATAAAEEAIPERLKTPATEEGEEEFRRWVYGAHGNGFSAHRENMRQRYERGEHIQFVPKAAGPPTVIPLKPKEELSPEEEFLRALAGEEEEAPAPAASAAPAPAASAAAAGPSKLATSLMNPKPRSKPSTNSEGGRRYTRKHKSSRKGK